MEENKYNELDKLFRSRLESEDITPAEWNTPSDDVFQNAMAEVNKQNFRRIPFLWILFALVLLLLSGVIFLQQRQMNRLQAEVEKIQSSSDMDFTQPGPERESNNALQGDLNTDSGAQAAISNSQQNNISQEASSFPDSEIDRNGQTLPPSPPIRDKNSIPISDKPQKQASSLPLNKASESDSLLMNMVETRERSRALNLAAIGMLPGSSSGIFRSLPYADLPDLLIEEDLKNVNKEASIVPYVIAGPAFSTFNMTDLPSVPYSLKKYDRYYIGFSLNAGIRQQLERRWSIDYQLTYNHLQNKSEFLEAMTYDKNLEMNGPLGTRRYETPVQIVSPVGSVHRQVSVDVSNNSIDDNAQLMNRADIDLSFTSVGLGVIPRFKIIDRSTVHLGAGIGPRIFYIVDFTEKMSFDLSYNSTSLMSESFSQEDPPMARSYYGGLYGDLELGVQFTPRIDLILQSGYYHSLTSIKTSTGSNPARTFLNSIHLNLGLQFQL